MPLETSEVYVIHEGVAFRCLPGKARDRGAVVCARCVELYGMGERSMIRPRDQYCGVCGGLVVQARAQGERRVVTADIPQSLVLERLLELRRHGGIKHVSSFTSHVLVQELDEAEPRMLTWVEAARRVGLLQGTLKGNRRKPPKPEGQAARRAQYLREVGRREGAM